VAFEVVAQQAGADVEVTVCAEKEETVRAGGRVE